MEMEPVRKRIHDPEDLCGLFCLRNPDVIKLSVAENVLVADCVKQYMNEGPPVREADLGYADAYGDGEIRALIASLINRTFQLNEMPLTPDLVSGFGGTRVAIRCVAALLCQTYHHFGKRLFRYSRNGSEEGYVRFPECPVTDFASRWT
jgi:hypothetical protein